MRCFPVMKYVTLLHYEFCFCSHKYILKENIVIGKPIYCVFINCVFVICGPLKFESVFSPPKKRRYILRLLT